MEDLAVVVVVGSVRPRAQTVIDRLCNQTLAGRLHIVLVDVAGDEFPSLRTGGGSRVTYLRRPSTLTWGEARAQGWKVATAPAVAFIEDHCFAARTWAEHVAEAFRGEWAAVGYAFTNANPQTGTSRACFLADYGIYAHPAESGQVTWTQSNNISYRRAAVERLGLPLEQLFENDWNVQKVLREAGGRIYQESRALASHHNFESVRELAQENFSHCRTMAAMRAQREGWSAARRYAQGLATFAVAPVVRTYRFVQGIRHKPHQVKECLRGLPFLAVSFSCGACGEAMGYLAGIGNADSELRHSLLTAARTPKQAETNLSENG